MEKLNRVELHLHTKLSDDISVIEPKEALEYAVEHSHKAIAFTNLNNVQDFPAIAEEYKKRGNHVKVIYGAELRYWNEAGEGPFCITVLVKNQAGIKALYKIISSIENDGVFNFVDLTVLKKNRENLLIGSCGDMGELYDAIFCDKDIEQIAAFYDYFEIFPAVKDAERAAYQKICALGDELGVPVVASGNCHYLNKEDEICHRVICMAKDYNGDNKKFYLHSTEEMLEEFSYLGEDVAYRTVVTEPNRITDLIEQVSPMREGRYMPTMENAYEQICDLVYAKAKEIYGDDLPKPIAERLKTELKYIENDDFATRFLIAYHMVKHMNGMGYYVGARGSVGSVLAAFLLGISETNPMPAHYYCPHCHFIDFEVEESDGFDLPNKTCPVCGNALKADGHNIPFEFYMGYNGSKMPDIALNFPSTKHKDAIAFLQELESEERLAYAGTISTMNVRAAERYIKTYEEKTGDCLTQEQRQHICDKLCGTKRGDGVHPGGIMVLPEGMEFEDFTPLRKSSRLWCRERETSFDFHTLRDTMLKLDVLGHDVPDIFKLLEDYTGVSIKDVPWNDSEIYALFARADTLAVAEFGANVVRDMLLKTKPGCFADLVKISGLSHGTGIWFDNCEDLIKNGHKLSELPALRDDVFLQLLQYGIDRENAFIIADYVRMGKLRCENEKTAKYIKLMKSVNVPEWYINSLQKICYMYPKAHAAACVMNAVRLAWFKIHYPTEFYAAYLSVRFNVYLMSEEDECFLKKIIEECSAKGIEVLEPSAENPHFKNYLPENGNIRKPYMR